MRSRAAAAGPFLQDAFEQLDEVLLRRTTSTAGAQSVPDASQDVRAARQQIQRWLVVFAREHLSDICTKLMNCAGEHAPAAPVSDAGKNPRIRLPQKADGPETGAPRDEASVSFFLLETLRRVLAAAAERGSLSTLPARDGALLPFCFDHLSLAQPAAIRHVAGLCIGILSRAQLKTACELFAGGLAHLSSDREQREYVAYQRAATHLELSTHSAEQAVSSTMYLRRLSRYVDWPRPSSPCFLRSSPVLHRSMPLLAARWACARAACCAPQCATRSARCSRV